MNDNRRISWILAGAMCVGLLGGCAADDGDAPDAADEAEVDIPSFGAFFGKSDTGYVGNRAAEIEATFTGSVRVNVDKTPDELRVIADEIQADPRSWQHREITSNVTEQLKYARNPLKAQKLNVNLEGGAPMFTEIDVIEGGLVLHYSVTVESLIKVKDLEEDGLTSADLVGRVIDARLPRVPAGLFERTAAKCTVDPDTGGAVDPHDLGDHNLFYYFAPDAADCPLTDADLVTAQYEVDSSFDAPTVYPEYHLLADDGRIDMVVIFGQITHGDLSPTDWGFRSFDSMTRSFRRSGFNVVETLPDNLGHTLRKTFDGGLVVTIDMFTPNNIADNVPRAEADAFFREQVKSNEIVYYNGHAFYGSLNVLDDPDVYPQDVYQIINMDACWSYAYYTKQIFRNRATDTDPTGYAMTDVINNTEPGITGSEATSVILYQTVFEGAAAFHAGRDASLFSWNNIIKYMNEHAEARAEARWSHKNPEIYGASGVRDNSWTPSGIVDPVDPGTTVRFESTEPVDVPDNDAAGAASTIVVAGAGSTESVTVNVQIEHTYIGDLRVSLHHNGTSIVLHDETGGGTENLQLNVTTSDFASTDANGEWSLIVSDHAAIDVGRVVRWSVELPQN